MPLTKGLETPPVNSHENVTVVDTAGNMDDTQEGYSIMARQFEQSAHLQSVCRVVPELANPIEVATNATPWEWGSFVTLIAAEDAPEVHYDISSFSMAVSGEGNYQFELYADAVFLGSRGIISRSGFPGGAPTQQIVGSGVFKNWPWIAAGYSLKMRAAAQDAGSSILVYPHWFPYVPRGE